MRASIRSLLACSLVLSGLSCAGPQRPQHAQAWCGAEDDRACGRRYLELWNKGDLFGPDDGSRESMLGWFGYRCSLDSTSAEALLQGDDTGLDCWRAGQLTLLRGKWKAALALEERGCESFGNPQACMLAGAFHREKFDLPEAHEWECRALRAAEERSERLPGAETLDCLPGSDSRERLKAAEMARLGRPSPPPNLVECSIHGCTLPGGRFVKPWIFDP